MKPDRGKKKAGAWLSALVTAALMACYGLYALALWLIEPDAFWFFLPWGLLPLAVIAGVLVALRERLKEIDAGEEDDAAQY